MLFDAKWTPVGHQQSTYDSMNILSTSTVTGAWCIARGNQDLLGVAVTLIGTVAVLFLTVSLVPFQAFAASYSLSLLKYIRNDFRLIFGFLVCFVLVLLGMAGYFFPPSNLILTASIVGVAVSLIVVAWLWRWCTTLLNPSEFIVPTIRKTASKQIDNAFNRLAKHKMTNEEKIEDLNEMMRQVMNTSEKTDPKAIEQFDVPSNYFGKVRDEISVLKGLLVSFIRANQKEIFESTWKVHLQIILHYLVRRQGYISHKDNFLIDFADDARDLILAARSANDVQYLRIIWRGLEGICTGAIRQKVIGSDNGYHYLASPVEGLLNESIGQDIVSQRVDSAFEAMKSYGAIGTRMAERGLCQSAFQILDNLSQYVVLCSKLLRSELVYVAKINMAGIAYEMLNHRKLGVNYHYPFEKFIESYDRVLAIKGQMTPVGIENPIEMWDADLTRDRSISSLVKVALFPAVDQDNVIRYNLDVVSDLVELMMKWFRTEPIRYMLFTHHLYQSGLWLLSFIDNEIALEMLIYRKVITIPTDENKKKASEILFKMLVGLIELIEKDYIDPDSKMATRRDTLSEVVSTLYLLIHLNEKHKLNLSGQINSVIKQAGDWARENLRAIRLQDDEWATLRVFFGYLEKKDPYRSLGRRLRRLLKPAGRRHIGTFHHAIVDFVRRPIGTMDTVFWGKIDEEIFGKKEDN